MKPKLRYVALVLAVCAAIVLGFEAFAQEGCTVLAQGVIAVTPGDEGGFCVWTERVYRCNHPDGLSSYVFALSVFCFRGGQLDSPTFYFRKDEALARASESRRLVPQMRRSPPPPSPGRRLLREPLPV